jgi:hypothetical protein
MHATLRIHHDGELVFDGIIQTKHEVTSVLGAFPPPQGRGSVAMLSMTNRVTTVWTSDQSVHGPTWVLSV